MKLARTSSAGRPLCLNDLPVRLTWTCARPRRLQRSKKEIRSAVRRAPISCVPLTSRESAVLRAPHPSCLGIRRTCTWTRQRSLRQSRCKLGGCSRQRWCISERRGRRWPRHSIREYRSLLHRQRRIWAIQSCLQWYIRPLTSRERQSRQPYRLYVHHTASTVPSTVPTIMVNRPLSCPASLHRPPRESSMTKIINKIAHAMKRKSCHRLIDLGIYASAWVL